jgi:hypothetical protein
MLRGDEGAEEEEGGGNLLEILMEQLGGKAARAAPWCKRRCSPCPAVDSSPLPPNSRTFHPSAPHLARGSQAEGGQQVVHLVPQRVIGALHHRLCQ